MSDAIFTATDKHTYWSRITYHVFSHPVFEPLPDEVAEEAAWFYFMLHVLSRHCNASGFLIHAGRPLTLDQLADDLHTTPRHLARQIKILKDLNLVDQPAEAYLVYGLPATPTPGLLGRLCLTAIAAFDVIAARFPTGPLNRISLRMIALLDAIIDNYAPCES